MSKEVECPYCYTTYEVENLEELQFQCVCESILEVEFDDDGEPYIDGY